MIKVAGKEDIDSLIALWKNDRQFTEAFTDFFFKYYFEKGKTLVEIEDGNIISAVSYVRINVRLNDKILRMSKIINPVGFHKNDMYELMVEYLGRQELASLSNVSPDTLYRRKEYYLNRYEFRKLDAGDTRLYIGPEDVLKCYKKFTSHFNGYRVRDLDDVKIYQEYVRNSGGDFVGYYRNGEIKGYAEYYLVGNTVKVEEVCYLDARAFVSLMNRLFMMAENITVKMSEKESLNFIDPSYDYEVVDYMGARINDMELFNRLYGSDVSNVEQGFNMVKKPLFFHEYI